MTCEPANTCGNGTLEGTEACDDGNLVNGDGCSAVCTLEGGGGGGGGGAPAETPTPPAHPFQAVIDRDQKLDMWQTSYVVPGTKADKQFRLEMRESDVFIGNGVVYSGFTVNGQRQNSNNMTIDGVANIDTGDNGGNMATTNIDAVAEFKLLTYLIGHPERVFSRGQLLDSVKNDVTQTLMTVQASSGEQLDAA